MELKCVDCCNLTGFKPSYPPIFHFGSPDTPVALFSINPSESEFETDIPPAPFEKWSVRCRKDATDEQIDAHIERQNEYFHTGHFLGSWFGHVEEFLQRIKTDRWGRLSFGIDQRPQNVVHLDIVKCATKGNWKSVPDDDKDKYLLNCQRHLFPQILHPSLKVIIMNGREVHDGLRDALIKTMTFESEHSEFLDVTTWSRDSDAELASIMRNEDQRSRLKQFATAFGTTVQNCRKRWNKISCAQDLKYPTPPKCELFRYVITDGKEKPRKWLVVGTSMRMSRESGQFSNLNDRAKVASILQGWINEFTP